MPFPFDRLYRGHPGVWIDSGYICIQMPDMPHLPPYEFEIDQCDTPAKLLRWLLHLSEKTWFDHTLVVELIVAVSAYYGWDCRGNGNCS